MRSDLPFLPKFDDEMAFENHHREEWVESSFDIEPARERQEYLGVSIDVRHINIFFLAISSIFFLFFMRTGYLQILQGRGLAALAERNKIKVQIIPAQRGVMYDRNGVLLTHNIPNFVVRVTSTELSHDPQERESELKRLSSLIRVPVDEIEESLKKGNGYQPQQVVDSMNYFDAMKFEVAAASMSGVSLFESQRRSYELSGALSLSHVLGFTGKISEKELLGRQETYSRSDTIGKEGLELQYETLLRGTYGRRDIEVDALGSEKGVLAEESAIDGKNMTLSIDGALQRKTEEVLAVWMKKMNLRRGVVIITQPKTGEILAFVSLPSYDNNLFAQGITKDEYNKLLSDPDRPLFNRGIYGEYPSGSTIKPVVAATALEGRVITAATSVLSVGGIHVGAWSFPDWKAGGHGRTNVIKAIAESVNTFFYTIGGGYGPIKGLGIDRLVEGFKKFGLGERTGIDFPGERMGFVPTPEWKERVKKEIWYIGDTYHVSIGQGDILVTPLQINAFTTYFANGGVSYVPHFVHAITDPNGLKTLTPPTEYKKNLVRSDVVAVVRDGMRNTITVGSGRRLSTLSVPVAGKTGTAQWGVNKEPHAWFTGWAPYDNPEVAITVLVEEGHEGSTIATPITYDILKWYFDEYKKVRQ